MNVGYNEIVMERSDQGPRKKRLLLVDDEPSILKTLGKRLELNGYEVLTATDGQEGLAKARLGRPDVIILDLMMPRLSGFEVCAALKRDEQMRHIPVIVFTATGQEMDETLCRECGADAYLNKAQQSAVLLEQVEALLGSLTAHKKISPAAPPPSP